LVSIYLLDLAAAPSPYPLLRLSLEVDGVMADTFDISLLPNVLDLQPKAHLMIGFGVTFLVLVWISVSTRIYVRLFMIRAFGWDDATLVMASVSSGSIKTKVFELTLCSSHSLPFVLACWLKPNTVAVRKWKQHTRRQTRRGSG
jgi:hypothetical protein